MLPSTLRAAVGRATASTFLPTAAAFASAAPPVAATAAGAGAGAGGAATATSPFGLRWLAAGVATAAVAAVSASESPVWMEPTDPMAWGWNQYGQLGLGTETDVPSPTVIEFLSDKEVVALVSSGPANSTAALTASGEVYTMGCGKDSRLGHGETIDAPNQTVPKVVEGLLGVKVASVAVGEYHMAAITDNGELWTFGKNRAGQLGHSNSEPGKPAKVAGPWPGKVVKASCGRQHTVALTDDGNVYTWGFGKDGALGHGGRDNELTPKPVEALAAHRVVDIGCGREFTVFLTDDRRVFACGLDGNGQLGQGFASRLQRVPKPVRSLDGKNVTKLVVGENHVFALTADGSAYSWGWGSLGQLGHGDRNDLGIPRHVAALASEKIVDGAGGGAHTLLLAASGKVFAMGRGRNGQLGRENHLESIAAYRTEPVEVDVVSKRGVLGLSAGDSHSLAVVRKQQ